MLDGAIWATELDSMNQKALTSTLLISHEEPKDVSGRICDKYLNVDILTKLLILNIIY